MKSKSKKKLKLNSKKEILNFGLDKFIEECRQSVFKYIKDWDNLTERMAYWVDMQDPYVTMTNSYIESVWWSLKELYKKDLLYEGYKVTPYCPRCGTPLSTHEVALGYKKIKEKTVVVKFDVIDEDYSILAWTTTPWTLPSNVALAVHPEFDYALFEVKGGEKYLMAEALVEGLFKDYELLKVFKGKELKGKEYEPLFPYFKEKVEKPAWKIVTGDFVTLEDGTGVVHIAPAFGEDDYNVGLKNNLPLINPVDEDGKFTDDIPILAGKFVKDTDELIVEQLEAQGKLITTFPYEHDYPYCWRCDSPLIYYALKSWFIKVTAYTENLQKNNKLINWYPQHMQDGRFGKWLEGARDWALSRNRFWGTPLPIWKCEKCEEIEFIGSIEELKSKATSKIEELDLHRPHVDKVKIKCKCGSEMTRLPFVIDCWYDSGAATFAQYHYPFENKEIFEQQFPYDFISEATDQTRGWFYTLLVLSTILFDKPAYKNVVVGGLLVDDKGEKMSKSNQNILDPWGLFNSVGADAVRLQMCATAPWNSKRFGEESMKEQVIPMLRTLWNCYEFTTRYMVLDNLSTEWFKNRNLTLQVEDKWIISKANSITLKVTSDLDSHNYHHAISHLNEFITEDLSRWYIKLIRDRLWLSDEIEKMHPSKEAAYKTLQEVFSILCRLLAPLTPFVAEEIYKNILETEGIEPSIHLQRWPTPQNINEQLEMEMDIARKIFEAGSNCRQEAKIKLRHPIAQVTITGDANVKSAAENLSLVIAKQLNTKEVLYKKELPGVKYKASPNFKVLGKEFKSKANQIADLIRKNSQKIKESFDSGKTIKIEGHEITAEMVADIRLEVPEKYMAAEFQTQTGTGMAFIDAVRSDSLLREALARDVIRQIQELRKKEDLEELEEITVFLSENEKTCEMIKEFGELIKTEVRAKEIQLKKTIPEGSEFSFEGTKISVAFQKP
ncbi:MAG: isoleucine--tRNA ligase [Candidatus Altiarchaeota archaeon]